MVFPAQAGIQSSWIPAFAGMTDRVTSHLRDTRLGNGSEGWSNGFFSALLATALDIPRGRDIVKKQNASVGLI